MPRWSLADIPALDGRVAIVTGANSGLGFETALELARCGADVTMLVRDAGRGEAAHDRLLASAPEAKATVALADLADLASVRSFATAWLAGGRPVDILVNNAGVMAIPQERTPDGFERHFATNHLGHFALTGRLLPALLQRADARVVTVSSAVASGGRIDLDDLQREGRRYSRWGAYSQSKLANLLFAFELDRRTASSGTSLVSAAAHPGFAATNLQAAAPRRQGHRWRAGVVAFGSRVVGQSAAAGALPLLYAATAPDVRGGDYFAPDGYTSMRGGPTLIVPPRRALDPELAKALWEASERLTGVTFAWPSPAHG